MGEYAKAESLLRWAIAAFEQRRNLNSAAVARANLALVLESAGKPAAALKEARAAWTLLGTESKPENQAELLFLMARIWREKGEPTRARSLMVRALKASEAMRYSTPSPEFGRTFTGVRDDYHDFYLDLLYDQFKNEPGSNAHLSALAHVDRLKTRGLGPLGIHPQTARTELRQKERALELLEQKRHRALGDHAGEARLSGIRREILAALEELDRVRAVLDGPAPGTTIALDLFPWGSPVIAWLDVDSPLLVFKLAEPRSYLWLVRHNGVALYPLPSEQRIREIALPLIHLMRFPTRDADAAQRDRLSRELGNLLLGPVAGRLVGKRLLVVKDGILHRVPLAALIDPATQEPLMASHELVCLPSASFAAALAARPSSFAGRTSLALFADPDYGRAGHDLLGAGALAGAGRSEEGLVLAARAAALEPLPCLPGSRLEAEALRKLVPETRMFLGAEANLDRFYELDKRAFAMFHFALHGLLHPFETRLSGLVFALVDEAGQPRPGFLRAQDVARMAIPAELVTLSACHTSAGEDTGGEGNWGLTQAFLQAGARRVVAGLWRVDDRAAAEIMPRFYRAMMVEGLSPSSALRRAQNATRQEGAFMDPSFWAGLELHGDWR